MNDKGALNWFASDDSMHQKGKWEFLMRNKYKDAAGVLYTINEMELCIYRCLALGTKSNRN